MSGPSLTIALSQRVAAARPAPVAAVLAAAILLVLLLGCLAQFVLPWGSTGYALLNMDGERSVPAVFSGGLLMVGGLLALLVAPPRLVHRLFGIGLVYASLDEVFALHELLQRTTGINWIKLYLPVFAASAVVAVLLVRTLRREARGAVAPLVAGAVCWASAQGLEWAEWLGTDVPQPGYVPMVLAEETLEDIGSALFILAVLQLVRSTRSAQSTGGVRPGRAAARATRSAS